MATATTRSFISIDPGQAFGYEFQLPADHPPGVYWYHPHRHGLVADQVFGGLYGVIIVADPTALPVAAERVLVISDISLDDAGTLQPVSTMAKMMGREGDLVLVNGQTQPQLSARPGERQRWRILNACTARYLRLRLDGQQMHLLGIDSGRYRQPREVSEVVLAPGNRADLLVTTHEGRSQLRAQPHDRGGTGMGMGGMRGARGSTDQREHTLATLDVTGTRAPAAAPLPPQPAPRDLRGESLTARRTLTFAAGMGMGMGSAGMQFTIDGKSSTTPGSTRAPPSAPSRNGRSPTPAPRTTPYTCTSGPCRSSNRTQLLQEPTWQDVVNLPTRSTTTLRVAFVAFPSAPSTTATSSTTKTKA
jgi:FtsP/CotA-like multicopper oxidase with cupredoxin domain